MERSICVSYSNDLLENLYGYRGEDYSHLHIRYYEQEEKIELNISEYYGIIHSTHPEVRRIKELGQYNMKNEQIGVWKHFNKQNVLYKTENFVIPRKEEEIVGMR